MMCWEEGHPYDCSQLKLFMKCPFKYYLRYGLGLSKPKEDEHHLEFGKHVHNIIEAYYRGEEFNIEEEWVNYKTPFGEIHKTDSTGKQICKDYIDFWMNVDKEFKIVSVEEKFNVKDTVKPFVVKIDTVLEKDGYYYGLEHKTTGIIKHNFFDQFHQDLQIEMEVLAIKQKYGSCEGVFINAAGVHTYRRKTERGPAGSYTDFSRRLIPKTPSELEDALWTTNHWIEQIEQARKSGKFVKSKGGYSCSGYKLCPNTDLCESSVGMTIDDYIAGNNYLKINPYEYLGERDVI